MKKKTLKKVTSSVMVTAVSISPFLPLAEVHANRQVESEIVREETVSLTNDNNTYLHELEEGESALEWKQRNSQTFSLLDWAYEENAKYIILTAARNDKETIYIPSEYNGKRVILQDLKIFPETMVHLTIESINDTKVGLQTFDISESFADLKVKSLDLRGLDTSKVTNMRGLFRSTYELISVNLEGWKTSSVTDMSEMFSNAQKLTSINLASFDTSNVTTMRGMFSGMSEMSTLDLSTLKTSKVTDMAQMFSGSNKLSSIVLTSFDTSNVTTMEGMFEGLEAMRTLDLKHFNTSKVTNMAGMFAGMKTLTSIDIRTFDTSNVESMASMFARMESLETLKLSNFNTSKVEDMSSMFSDMKELEILDIASFDTSKVRSMSGMFSGSNLSYLDLNHFNTINVRDMSSMFAGMENIISLDLTYFDTLNVDSVSGMFSEMKKLKNVDLMSFDLRKVEDVSGMFGVWDRQPGSLVIFAKDPKIQAYDFEKDNRSGSVLSYSMPTISSNVISGVGEIGTEIKLSSGGEVLNETVIGSSGAYELAIPKQALGSTLMLEVTTPKYEIVNKKLVVRDEFKTFTMKTVPLPSTTKIEGMGVPGAKVEIYLSNGEVLGATTVDAQGNYKVTIPQQEVNTVLNLKQSKFNYAPVFYKVAVYDELTVFELPQISINSTALYGKGIPGAKVGIYTSNGTRLAITTVDSKGNYKLTIPKQKAGTILTMKQAKTGYGTLVEQVTVLDEFKNFTINSATTSSVAIYGTGEPGANVKAFVNGKAISSLTKVNSKGNYKIVIPKQKAGTVVQVKMAKNGYLTTSKKTTILGELNTFTSNTISTSTTTISGKGVFGAKVGVYTSAGKQLAITTVNSKGDYKLVIPKQKAGTKLVLKQTKSGYATLSKNVTVLNEFKTFTYSTVKKTSTTIKGKGVAGAKVGVYTSTGKQLAIATVNSKGDYKLVIPKQKAGTKLVLKQTKSGYATLSKNVTVLNEFKTFTYSTVKKTSTTIKGKGVAGAKVGVYTSTGKQLAIATVNSKGDYKLVIPKQKAGTKLVLKQTKSGYATLSKNVTVTK